MEGNMAYLVQQKLVIVNGFPRSGKDTFMDRYMELSRENRLSVHKHSTIDTVKAIAKQMGWDGEKTAPNRAMLSELKDFYTKHFDGPLNEIKALLSDGLHKVGTRIGDSPDGFMMSLDVLFTAMREPEEIERTKEWCENEGILCVTVLVSGVNGETNHLSHSDAKVLMYDYDVEVSNKTSLENFIETIDTLYAKDVI